MFFIREKNMSGTEKPTKVKVKKLWVGISLIVIGSLIIVAGIVGYYIEKANCLLAGYPSGCGFFSAAGGLGTVGFCFPGGIIIVIGLVFLIRGIRRL
jgi:hypothetical protein